jgi:hypothetical protein
MTQALTRDASMRPISHLSTLDIVTDKDNIVSLGPPAGKPSRLLF